MPRTGAAAAVRGGERCSSHSGSAVPAALHNDAYRKPAYKLQCPLLHHLPCTSMQALQPAAHVLHAARH